MLLNTALYGLAFLFIWLGAGLIVSSMDKFSRRLGLSSFTVSFVILGLLTSTPEFAVGLQAVAENDSEIFVGNLLGGVIAIFLLIIPLLALIGNGIKLKHELDKPRILACLGVILMPSLFVLDKRVTNLEGIFMIGLYVALIIFVQSKRGFFDNKHSHVLNIRAYSYKDILKLIVGIGIIFVASRVIVDQTLYFSDFFGISPFVMSLVILSLGTNLPEISLAIRSVFSKKKDIAFGDYMGSAAANTFLFGLFTLMTRGEVVTISNFFVTFLFIAAGLVLFYIFASSKNMISRREGFALLVVYALFVYYELFGHKVLLGN